MINWDNFMYLQQYPSAYGWQELYLPFVRHRRVRWQSDLLPAALLYWEYLLPDYGYSSSALHYALWEKPACGIHSSWE